MPRYLKYEEWSPQEETLNTLAQAKNIIEEYAEQGYSLTLRQLYYQLVARDMIPNQVREYNRLGRIVSRGRKAGYLPWDTIEDRTRNLKSNPHWRKPSSIIRASAESFQLDLWKDQDFRVEVWIEKDALVGVIEGICSELDVNYFSCRGYTSDSEMWRAAERHRSYAENGQTPIVLHLGDHDPSGIDMSRDIQERLRFFGAPTHVDRVALNMEQVEEYDPPPNPAKETDSRFEDYLIRYGSTSWELDALDPTTLTEVIESNVEPWRDDDLFKERLELQEEYRSTLTKIADRYPDVEDLVS